ncbi:hypothetical protein PPYR_07923 [Photinus pyralis]|uniref:Scavenger receptor class B member 1 n=1 Tax=Photinus pyralis TaxID=7054 RepID=A0A5N4ARY2_PHOPY|nr:scavenger receptor class B member 1-like [Photinus pyralis]XP_031339021.1 scavenger receptor class B member 1-like [Photinus pyralis]KAB0800043.1 hypothetical protein PPYR_07923 [Photinus pyralis]
MIPNGHATEDLLLQSSSVMKSEGDKIELKCDLWKPFVFGMISALLGVLLTVWTPSNLLLNERLRMRPGLPPYEWWVSPPGEILLKVYLFNITNLEAFLNGTDQKLNLDEVGPIIYQEKLIHTNVTHNDNGTLSYTAKRFLVYLPAMNHLDLNDTLVVPNIAVLGMASYFGNSMSITKSVFNALVRNLESRSIIRTTIYDYLWNSTDPVLDIGNSLFPILVPVKNLGILAVVYEKFEHRITAYIGTKCGPSRFFLIDQFDGSQYLPDHGCEEKLVNATEGVAFHPFLTKNETILYWRKTLCKVVELDFEREVVSHGFNAYRYTLRNETFRRKAPEPDCFIGDPPLPNGLIDVSKCFFNIPVAISFPHFLNADPVTTIYVNGLKPTVEQHGSFIHIEPITGVPLETRAQLQANLVLGDLSGFNEDIEPFSNIIIPLFCFEFNQAGLPSHISNTVFFIAVILPYLQVIVIVVLYCTGLGLITLNVYKFATKRQKRYLKGNIVQSEECNMLCKSELIL